MTSLLTDPVFLSIVRTGCSCSQELKAALTFPSALFPQCSWGGCPLSPAWPQHLLQDPVAFCAQQPMRKAGSTEGERAGFTVSGLYTFPPQPFCLVMESNWWETRSHRWESGLSLGASCSGMPYPSTGYTSCPRELNPSNSGGLWGHQVSSHTGQTALVKAGSYAYKYKSVPVLNV